MDMDFHVINVKTGELGEKVVLHIDDDSEFAEKLKTKQTAKEEEEGRE